MERQSRTRLRKTFVRLINIVLSVYLLACLGCAGFQRRLIYFPPALTEAQLADLARESDLQRWTNLAGEYIGMRRPSPQQPAKGAVLICYGNGSCAVGCAHYADVIQSVAPLDVFILEYPGYCGRAGAPSEKSLFRAADEALQLLPADIPLYLVGESLGTGVTAYLAGKNPERIHGLVLLAPYNRLSDVAQAHMPLLPVRLLLVDRFDSQRYLRNFHGPVATLLAGRDTVVPEKFGRRLYDSYSGPKRLWRFPEGNHGTVMIQPVSVWKEIIGFLQNNRN